MSKVKRETVADIVAEMRVVAREHGFEQCDWADRIEAANRREVAASTRECERLKEERNRSGLAARAEVSERLHALTKESERLRAALKPVLECKVLGAMTAEVGPGESEYCSNIIFKAQRIYNEGGAE